MTIRVLVADEQAMGFRMLLSGEDGIEVVAEATDGLEAVAKAERRVPDLILMDIRMPRLDGLEATRRILAARPGARVLVLTTFDVDEYVYEALRSGNSGSHVPPVLRKLGVRDRVHAVVLAYESGVVTPGEGGGWPGLVVTTAGGTPWSSPPAEHRPSVAGCAAARGRPAPHPRYTAETLLMRPRIVPHTRPS